MKVKDNFSDIAASYAAWRPEYPQQLFTFLASLSNTHNKALDCGTGNGQAAKLLAAHYKDVYATDISAAQLQHAAAMPNIHYSVSAAEKTDFPDHFFDIICAAQAVHWFNHPLFYKEVERIIQPGGILALIGYGLISIDKEIDALIQVLYKDVLGTYWDEERKFIDDQYQSLPFPYSNIPAPQFEIEARWNCIQLTGYLNTWSALGNYKKKNGKDPLQDLQPALQKTWGDVQVLKTVYFPVISKIAIVQ